MDANLEDAPEEYDHEFDIGLSFAGEQREYVEQVAEELDYRGIRVYYDAYDHANLWGRDLAKYFKEVFQNRCRYIIVFASKDYAAKMWPTFELENILRKVAESQQDFILPIKFDDTIIPGIPYTMCYLDAHKETPVRISQMAAQRLGINEAPARIEFAFLCTGIELTPQLNITLPGFNMKHPSEGPLLTFIKVVFSRGERPVATLEVRATDRNGRVVGKYNGWFTANGIRNSEPDSDKFPHLDTESAFLHGVLISDAIQLNKTGVYRISWYLNDNLQRTSSMNVYLPE